MFFNDSMTSSKISSGSGKPTFVHIVKTLSDPGRGLEVESLQLGLLYRVHFPVMYDMSVCS